MPSTTTPDFRDMNTFIERFKKKPAISSQHSAFSPGGGIQSASESPKPEPQRALRNTEGAQQEGAAETDGVRRETRSVFADYVQAKDGTLVHPRQIEWEVENRIRKEMGLPDRWATEEQRIAWHRRQLALLEKADAAPRCEHIFLDGTACQSPRMRKHKYCYAHARMLEVRPKKLRLLPAEDANSIMWNIMEIERALVDDEISEKKAGLLLYGQQLGLIAVRGLTFKETDGDSMVRAMPKNNVYHGDTEARREEEPGDRVIGTSGDLKTQEQKPQRAQSTTEDLTADAEGKGSPLIHGKPGQVNADDTDRKSQTAEPQRTQRNTGEHRQECLCLTSMERAEPSVEAGNVEKINPGDELAKSLFFGDEVGGRGIARIADIAVIARDRETRPAAEHSGS